MGITHKVGYFFHMVNNIIKNPEDFMETVNLTKKLPLTERGLLLGCISSVFGSMIFSVENYLEILVKSNATDFPIFWSLMVGFIYSFFISFIPASLGGYLIGYLISNDLKKGNFSKKKASIKGLILGSVLGIGLGLLALFDSGPRIPVDFILYESMKGLLLAGFIGWIIARQLGKWVEKI
jgi:hypothetical protein